MLYRFSFISACVRISNPWVPKLFFIKERGEYDLQIEEKAKCSFFKEKYMLQKSCFITFAEQSV